MMTMWKTKLAGIIVLTGGFLNMYLFQEKPEIVVNTPAMMCFISALIFQAILEGVEEGKK